MSFLFNFDFDFASPYDCASISSFPRSYWFQAKELKIIFGIFIGLML